MGSHNLPAYLFLYYKHSVVIAFWPQWSWEAQDWFVPISGSLCSPSPGSVPGLQLLVQAALGVAGTAVALPWSHTTSGEQFHCTAVANPTAGVSLPAVLMCVCLQTAPCTALAAKRVGKEESRQRSHSVTVVPLCIYMFSFNHQLPLEVQSVGLCH